MGSTFNPTYTQGDNLPPISIKHDVDMTDMLTVVHATAHKEYKVVASALAADTTIKVNDPLAKLLTQNGVPTAGLRAFLPVTKEWVKITAIDGIICTVTRAQMKPDGTTPTVAKDIPTGAELRIHPLDAVPLSSELDPTDTSNKTVIHTLNSSQTTLIPETYNFDIYYANSTGANAKCFTAHGTLTITSDSNEYGGS